MHDRSQGLFLTLQAFHSIQGSRLQRKATAIFEAHVRVREWGSEEIARSCPLPRSPLYCSLSL